MMVRKLMLLGEMAVGKTSIANRLAFDRFGESYTSTIGTDIYPSLDKAIDEVLKSLPDAHFLDDYLKPKDSALQTIPLVRRAGYRGPIIVVSGEVDRPRRIELRKAGASDIIHKDDIDSVNVSEALIRAYAPRGQ